jgi:hypothetical protein
MHANIGHFNVILTPIKWGHTELDRYGERWFLLGMS